MRHVTRREVLAGITAAGAAGAVSGVGTAALLVDRETLASSVASGRVELRVDVGDGPTDATDGPLALPLPALEAGDADSVDLTYLLPDEPGVNPAYLWLRADCGGPSALGSFLRLTVSHASGAGAVVFDGTYREFLTAFEAGIPLDPRGVAVAAGEQTCLDAGSAVPLTVAYELSSGYVGDETATLLLEAVAVQCRRVDPVSNPFAGAPSLSTADCDALTECDCCVRVGKYDLDESNTLTTRTYPFTDGSDAYLLSVSDVETNDEGEAMAARFRVVLADDPDTALETCRITLKTRKDGVYAYEGDALDGVIGVEGNAISNVTASVCLPRVEGEDGSLFCPDDLVAEFGGKPSGTGGPGNSGGPNNAGGNGGKK